MKKHVKKSKDIAKKQVKKGKEVVKRRYPFIIFLLFLAFWFILFMFISPQQLISYLGLHNAYISMFIIATLASAFSLAYGTTFPLYVTFVLGGLNFIILGVVATVGMSLGDLLYFYLGKKAREHIFPKKAEEKMKKFSFWLKGKPSWLIAIIVFIYVTFTPFPNNLLTLMIGIVKIKLRRIILPILLGNMALILIVGYIAQLSL